MAHETINFTLKVWRQKNANEKGYFEEYPMKDVNTHMSFLEMLDVLNERLVSEKKQPISFAHDCREGICGTCGMVINGRPHGSMKGTTVCQLHMREFAGVKSVVIEPFRAQAFPIIRDLVVDRSAFDRIIQSGGYISVNTGGAPDGNAIPVGKEESSEAFDAATCIGCGACVASCPNAAAMLFTSAKVSHLAYLPQGEAEARTRVQKMIAQMDSEGFGACSNIGACEVECPKGISLVNIAKMNRDYLGSILSSERGA